MEDKTRKKFYVVVLLIFIAGIVIVTILQQIQRTDNMVKGVQRNDFDVVYGADTAPLTIYMYSNYQCAFCRKFFQEVMPVLQKHYLDKGKVRLVVKLINPAGDANIQNALKTAVCINQYGDFEKLHELLLVDPDVVYHQKFVELTDDLIQKDEQVAECVLGGSADEYLNNNLTEFNSLGLTGTPTFIINNKIYKGFKSYGVLHAVIKKELKESL